MVMDGYVFMNGYVFMDGYVCHGCDMLLMSKLALFWSIGSQPGRAVKTLLDIGRIPHEATRINVAKLEHKSEEYLKMYPLGKIPVIKDGDFVVGESNAILTYLCEKHPQVGHYHGATIEQRAITNQYLSWYQGNFRPALFTPFRKFLSANIAKTTLKEEEMVGIWKDMWTRIAEFEGILSHSGK
jgi:glutathione S-transferase